MTAGRIRGAERGVRKKGGVRTSEFGTKAEFALEAQVRVALEHEWLSSTSDGLNATCHLSDGGDGYDVQRELGRGGVEPTEGNGWRIGIPSVRSAT